MRKLDKKISARVSHDLYKKLDIYAEQHSRSLNNVINIALQQFLEKEDKINGSN